MTLKSQTPDLTITPDETTIIATLHLMTRSINFKVQYIGQAFGKNGSRNALDRLRKHETLQKISLRGIPQGYTLQLLLLKVIENGPLVTLFNPFATDTSNSDERIKSGLDKHFSPDEAEQTTLFEAAMIRHFEPEYNKEFKNSFPSTNLKVLNDCYDKDFATIIAEINFDSMPYSLCSDKQPPSETVISIHSLHKEEDRKIFFSR